MSDVNMTSGGQAIIPPFHLFYESDNHLMHFYAQIANISNNSVHVVITYFNQSGNVQEITEMDIAAKEAVSTRLDMTGVSPLSPFYGTIEWTGAYTAQKPLVAHAYVRYANQNDIMRGYDVDSLEINGGMPF